MSSMIEGILKYHAEILREIDKRGIGVPLTPRARRSIVALLNYPPDAKGWKRPADLYKEKVCGYNKTTDTWNELYALDIIEINKEAVKNRGRIMHPTRFRLKTDKVSIYRILLALFQYQEGHRVLIDFNIEPPMFFIEHKQKIREALKDLKNREVKGKK